MNGILICNPFVPDPKAKRHKLPFTVMRGIVERRGRFKPPANRDQGMRKISRDLAHRLSVLPPRLWELNIDWKRYADYFDSIASVPKVDRTFSDEKETHSAIAHSLRKASGLLTGGGGQTDPLLIGAIMAAGRIDPGKFKLYVPKRMHRIEKDAPRLSDFLKCMAEWIEGESSRQFGLHRLAPGNQGLGADGAALVAFERLSGFMREHTGKPHDNLVKEIVKIYHPNSSDKDWARTIRARNGKSKEK